MLIRVELVKFLCKRRGSVIVIVVRSVVACVTRNLVLVFAAKATESR